MSKVTASGVSYTQRETALNITHMKPTLGIGQVHADHKSDYNAYITARRGLMNQYIPATFASDGSEARRISALIQSLDAKYTKPKSTTTITPILACDRSNNCRKVGELIETKTTGSGLQPPTITRGVSINGQTRTL